MRIYQYIFYFLEDGSIQTVYGTNFCDVTNRAYELYLQEWAIQDADRYCYSNKHKMTLCEFCQYYNQNDGLMYGGFSGNCGTDIITCDVIINAEEVIA